MKMIEEASLGPYNSFGIAVKADMMVHIEQPEDIADLFSQSTFLSAPRIVLGGGSNTLFTQDFHGWVVLMASHGITDRSTPEYFEVSAAAGVKWNDLVRYCMERNIPGFENLTLIPGTVGAAPVQNIGAYGVELKEFFYSLKAYNIKTGKFQNFDKAACHFSYRSSSFKTIYQGQYIISEVTFRFPVVPTLRISYGAISEELVKEQILHPSIQDISRIVAKIRIEKLPDPSFIGNAGSFFKNPVIPTEQLTYLQARFPSIISYPAGQGKKKLAAGWMIEQCGLKGVVWGRTGTWKNQALVLVNRGGASGMEILDFSKEVQAQVMLKFGIGLEPEVNII